MTFIELAKQIVFCCTLVACGGPAFTIDSNVADAAHWIDPGVECLNRETAAAQSRTQQLWQKRVEIETQIDVMSGAYELRQQLESEPEDKALKHALVVLKDDTIYEQSKVARKFLRDRDAIVGSGIKPTIEEIVEHETRQKTGSK